MENPINCEKGNNGNASPEYEVEEVCNQNKLSTDFTYKHEIRWFFTLGHILLHSGGIYGLYVTIFYTKFITFVWAFILGVVTCEAVALGAHRFYSHRSFKVKTPLRVALLIFYTMSGQNSMWNWVRDHRLHHQFSDTDADPHNSRRGFFYSHMGWLMVRRHPVYKAKIKQIDMSDIESDRILMFINRNFLKVYTILSVIFCLVVPMYFWNETAWNAFFTCYVFRYSLTLNIVWCINSFAHLYGTKPYDKRIRAVYSKTVWFVTLGDGWHNFHHAFPWDHRVSEFGHVGGLHPLLIRLFTYMGQMYDLKSASPELIAKHLEKYGDGSHETQLGDKALTRKYYF